MQILSQQVLGYLDRASWIRKMFETGAAMKAEFGADAVFDFSLGNPDMPPPAAVCDGLKELCFAATKPYAFGYMPNAGYPWAREALAAHVSVEQKISLTSDNIVVTCGAAGGLNAIFRAVLDAGDEVLGLAPYFVEYGFYVENHGGVFKTAKTQPLTFELDLAAIEEALTPDTRVVLVNSPNNPTGQVYSEEEIKSLAALLTRKSEVYGRPIFLVADEPYRFLVYDAAVAPPVLSLYPYSLVASSFSKNLSLAGERVGYVAVSPLLPERAELVNGLILTNRILGFVNAPAIGQALMTRALGSQVDLEVYARRRAALTEVLTAAGYVFTPPKGAFYFFPQVPGDGDDVAFVRRLQEEKILAVPGVGFGYPGYFRLAFCTDESVIRRAAEGFGRAARG